MRPHLNKHLPKVSSTRPAIIRMTPGARLRLTQGNTRKKETPLMNNEVPAAFPARITRAAVQA
ncbi:MAG: hypothetical protein WAN11_25080 [Syntrophobacteraceae bacterium]